jgi:hypothetical protein
VSCVAFVMIFLFIIDAGNLILQRRGCWYRKSMAWFALALNLSAALNNRILRSYPNIST